MNEENKHRLKVAIVIFSMLAFFIVGYMVGQAILIQRFREGGVDKLCALILP
jgi:hypothetical protein